MTITNQGVIPLQPDAWIWVGDMAYLDTQLVDCVKRPDAAGCQCESGYLAHPPSQCAAGDVQHAALKWRTMVRTGV